MGEGSGTAREISLGEDFGDVAVRVNGVRVEISHDGIVTTKPAPANDAAAKTEAPLQIGDPDDGGVYVGLSAEDGKPLHAALNDSPECKTYEEALAAAEELKSAHPTAHVPTLKELDGNLFANRFTGKLAGTFNTSGSSPDSVYRSSKSCTYDGASIQWFGDGHPDHGSKHVRLPVRLVW